MHVGYMRIGIYSIFVGPNYTAYYEGFLGNMKDMFFPGHDIQFFIVSDDKTLRTYPFTIFHYVNSDDGVWPIAALNKFKYFLQFPAEVVKSCDYIFFMKSNARCYEKIIFPLSADYVFTQHYWFVNKPYSLLTLEKDAASQACVPYEAGKKYTYVGGGLYGARTGCFVEMSRMLEKNTDTDFANKHIAVWHDESHLNWFYNVNRPANVMLLDWRYHVDEPTIKTLLRRKVRPKMIYLHKRFKILKPGNGDYKF